ncbi:hypothetical protein L6R52_12610, partial [Myxococcota bacterium]|nr:hypothetical protein [Myxococcota bacterium]
PVHVALVLLLAVALHVVLEPRLDRAEQAFRRWPALAQAATAVALGAVLYANTDAAVARRAFIYFQF